MSFLLDLSMIVLVLSISANIALLVYIRKSRKKPSEQLTIDARAILADLSNGSAIVKVEYIDRRDIFLRSPRHQS